MGQILQNLLVLIHLIISSVPYSTGKLLWIEVFSIILGNYVGLTISNVDGGGYTLSFGLRGCQFATVGKEEWVKQLDSWRQEREAACSYHGGSGSKENMLKAKSGCYP